MLCPMRTVCDAGHDDVCEEKQTEREQPKGGSVGKMEHLPHGHLEGHQARATETESPSIPTVRRGAGTGVNGVSVGAIQCPHASYTQRVLFLLPDFAVIHMHRQAPYLGWCEEERRHFVVFTLIAVKAHQVIGVQGRRLMAHARGSVSQVNHEPINPLSVRHPS